MIVSTVHRCDVCCIEKGVHPNTTLANHGWSEVALINHKIELCEVCSPLIQASGDLLGQLIKILRKNVQAPRVGDKVELLVDGYRGKFKGRMGEVIGAHGSDEYASYSIRVPGEVLPGEDQEYCGPYSRDQIRLVERKRV